MNEERVRVESMVSFRVTPEEKKALVKMAEKEERKLADTARRIFRKGLQIARRGEK